MLWKNKVILFFNKVIIMLFWNNWESQLLLVESCDSCHSYIWILAMIYFIFLRSIGRKMKGYRYRCCGLVNRLLQNASGRGNDIKQWDRHHNVDHRLTSKSQKRSSGTVSVCQYRWLQDPSVVKWCKNSIGNI
jgi:hypothetical protein